MYEELGEPKEGQPIKRSMSVTPGLSGIKSGEGARPKDSFKRMSAFQDYTSKMMSALNNPWKPQSRKTATPTWSAVQPLVYVSAAGTPVSDTQFYGDGDDSSSSTDSSAPRKRKHKSPKYVYVLQGPPGLKGQEGQPGQAGEMVEMGRIFP